MIKGGTTTRGTNTGVREHLVQALTADLVGPFDAGGAEVLSLPPSRFYLTGFLAPDGKRYLDDPTAEEELAAGIDTEVEEAAPTEPGAKQRKRFPASIGMSVLLPATTDTITATVSWADYRAEKREDEDGKPRLAWRRLPREPVVVELALDPATLSDCVGLPGAGGVGLVGQIKPVAAPGLPAGTRALSLFVVNRRPPAAKNRSDEAFIFQVGLMIAAPDRIIPRPNQRGEGSDEWDEQVADLQFRKHYEYAVGHGVSVAVPEQPKPVSQVCTAWVPSAEVRRVKTQEEPSVETAMEVLAELKDGAEVAAALEQLPRLYSAWILEQRQLDPGSDERRQTRDRLMDEAQRASQRIAEGINLLANQASVLEAFRLANRAMAMASRQLHPDRGQPKWRLFQLAFVLLNLPAMADQHHGDRANVELIFFPTGGGKTEAYLGVIAFTLVLRRLRGLERADGGLGVAVLLRYTLRLLTLDQLERAAALICALELLRRLSPDLLGEVRFSCGLWVGKTATANTLSEVKRSLTDFKNKHAESPFPLTNCPWCRKTLNGDGMTLEPATGKPEAVVVGCSNFECEFSAGNHRDGLPVLFVDEQIYRELPCFLVATVDKLAMLPWRGETGMLFGRVHARDGYRFFGPLDRSAAGSVRLRRLYPPELIVQDELHLISGPLGTMVGLYETAIETLCSRQDQGLHVLPRIIAATATVRRASHQIRALFGRTRMSLFPPPGCDDSETYFATGDCDSPGRLYIGVAAPGRPMKAVLIRSYVALLAAAYRCYDRKGDSDQTADGAMTLAGYFNSLRELGGMRRLVEDEVRARCAKAEDRRPLDHSGRHPWYRNRQIQIEPVELTSRESTSNIKQAKGRLNLPHGDPKHVDVLLASNMISVGVDIDRLGLMVVAGQPKSASEYIQASSRVGRNPRWPGLVVTCFNVHKPRDRSHYERFTVFHQSFYRMVEAASLTPFSGPALDRGLAAVLIAIARHHNPILTPAAAASLILQHPDLAEAAVAALAERARLQPGVEGDSHGELVDKVQARGRDLLDTWKGLVDEAREAAAERSYSPFDRDRTAGKPLLFTRIDEDQPEPGTDDAKFAAPTSMRDVEPTVHLWLKRRRLGGGRS